MTDVRKKTVKRKKFNPSARVFYGLIVAFSLLIVVLNLWQDSQSGYSTNPFVLNVLLFILAVSVPVCGILSLLVFVLDWRADRSTSKIKIANAIVTLVIVIIWIVAWVLLYLLGQILNTSAY
jgi:hypothetical protein